MRQNRWNDHHWLAGTLVVLLIVVAACSGDDDATDAGDATEPDAAPLPSEYEGYTSEMYNSSAAWLCRPGQDDVCSRDLDVTIVKTDGTVDVRAHEPAANPPVDCFYVYPTISNDETPNSDMEAGETEEIYVTHVQAARLTETCRVFAPLYRQATLSMIGDDAPDTGGVDPRAVAYDDVVDAFRHYVANESDGRGFVLLGHSQGSGHLTRLIADEIDGEPTLQDRLVGAYILGSGVAVPDEGEVVGGTFDEIPLCEAAGQVGCIITYATFRSTAPPTEGAMFGRPRDGEGVAGCVNPAAPEGGPAELSGYVLVGPVEGSLGSAERFTGFESGADDPPEINTPFVALPGHITGECVFEDGFNYLSLTVNADPEDPRVDDLPGDILPPEWGTHLVDVSVAMGDIIANVKQQANAYGT